LCLFFNHNEENDMSNNIKQRDFDAEEIMTALSMEMIARRLAYDEYVAALRRRAAIVSTQTKGERT
jgi:hypothetical protein